ncbi:MAG: Re/Si-specific NAD(P)(+) transhydrogenase subunit alpha [Polyangiaceae bacterium]
MIVGIPREIGAGERRVAATPETTKRLLKLGFEVKVETGAGELAAFQDSDFVAAGATIEETPEALWQGSDVVLKVRPPTLDEVALLREGATLISFIWPRKNPELLAALTARRATALGMDLVPRITRAQKMDALSSMANIAGYRAVIEAASFFGRFFTGQITAAGQVPPARVLVIGAGVAGLAAIGAARSLGAIVRAFDTRPGVKEQVESMGAEFLDLDFEEEGGGEGGYAREMSPAFIAAEMALFAAETREADIVITTALIPGKPAPILITTDMVEAMKKGSVIVDLAAENGGNCAVTQPEKVVTHRGITVIGFVDLPSRLAPTASQLYGTNLCHMLADMGGGKNFHVDLDDEVIRGSLVVHQGEVCWPPPPPPQRDKDKEAPVPSRRSSQRPGPPSTKPVATKAHKPSAGHGATAAGGKPTAWPLVAGAVLIALASRFAPTEFVGHLTVFVLSCFVGWQVVWSVTPALHTPLMSVTNAISGIILVGGMLHVSGSVTSPATLLGAIALLLATINVAGGFLVTQRMLKMFSRSSSTDDSPSGGDA